MMIPFDLPQFNKGKPLLASDLQKLTNALGQKHLQLGQYVDANGNVVIKRGGTSSTPAAQEFAIAYAQVTEDIPANSYSDVTGAYTPGYLACTDTTGGVIMYQPGGVTAAGYELERIMWDAGTEGEVPLRRAVWNFSFTPINWNSDVPPLLVGVEVDFEIPEGTETRFVPFNVFDLAALPNFDLDALQTPYKRASWSSFELNGEQCDT